MDIALAHIPDKAVVDDIINFITYKSDKHFFSDIYNGMTMIYPSQCIEYSIKDGLYTGCSGFGYYMCIDYDCDEKTYYFYSRNNRDQVVTKYECEYWDDMVEYVRNFILDLFISLIDNNLSNSSII
jgi:hypothetical protein